MFWYSVRPYWFQFESLLACFLNLDSSASGISSLPLSIPSRRSKHFLIMILLYSTLVSFYFCILCFSSSMTTLHPLCLMLYFACSLSLKTSFLMELFCKDSSYPISFLSSFIWLVSLLFQGTIFLCSPPLFMPDLAKLVEMINFQLSFSIQPLFLIARAYSVNLCSLNSISFNIVCIRFLYPLFFGSLIM
jgi:hypothetical protein